MSTYRIVLWSPPEGEHFCAEMYVDDVFIGQICESGPEGKLTLEFAAEVPIAVPLDVFEQALVAAKSRLAQLGT